jgi:hypothetical protein
MAVRAGVELVGTPRSSTMHVDTLYAIAAIHGRELEAAAGRARLRSAEPRRLAAAARLSALLQTTRAAVRPTPLPAPCCA